MGRLPSVLGCVLALVISSALSGDEARRSGLEEGAPGRILAGYGRLPLRFERNEGLAGSPARYLSRGPGYTLFVTPTEMVLSLWKEDVRRLNPQPPHTDGSRPESVRASVLRVKLVEARATAQVEGVEELAGRANYFIGSDPSQWRRNVTGYARVRCHGVYPGIDLVYHGKGKELEYDFVVAPGSDPGRIRLGFEGAQSLQLDAEGNLVVALEGGELVKRAPQVYQEVGSRREAVRGRWVLLGTTEAGFEVGAYDRRQALVIDPVLTYSTYLGGGDLDYGYGIAVDRSGSAYVTGVTYSTDFPTQGPRQTDQAVQDVFVTKLSPSGDGLVYSTYLGGNGGDFGLGIAVDSLGSAYVTGYTSSTNFPTQNPYQTDKGGDDAFVTKLSPAGDALVYSTYLGGGGSDASYGIALDGAGSAYVSGDTASTDFPTLNAYQTDQPDNDAFVTKLSPAGNSLVFSTYLGGSGFDRAWGPAVDSLGSVYVTGHTASTNFPLKNPYQTDQSGNDAFVTKLSPSGTSLVYSTYLGGNGYDEGFGIAVDHLGSAYVTGRTFSTDFPTKNPYQTDQFDVDAFVTKLSPSGSTLVYSTYLGGSGADNGRGVAVDSMGSAYVVGDTSSTNFPTRTPYQGDQALQDVFVTKVWPTGSSLDYSTYLGGDSVDAAGIAIALDGSGNAYVTGDTWSSDFPTQGPYQTHQAGLDVFVTKLTPSGTGYFTITPCRLVDTRKAAGPLGSPALVAGADRVFTITGQCGIPSVARAMAVNVAVTTSSADGSLLLYPAGTAVPPVPSSTINYSAGQNRANNAIVAFDPSTSFAVHCAQASGTVEFIVDVSGYFE